MIEFIPKKKLNVVFLRIIDDHEEEGVSTAKDYKNVQLKFFFKISLW